MTTAPADAPDVAVDEVISTVVRMLLARDRDTIEQLAATTGISRDVLFRRLRRGGNNSWKASEVAALASHFEVPVADLYEPSWGGLKLGFRKGRFLDGLLEPLAA
jgi:hypothetical protein